MLRAINEKSKDRCVDQKQTVIVLRKETYKA